MAKVTFLLILFLFNIVGLSVAQTQSHEHEHDAKEELVSTSYKELGQTHSQQDEHKNCETTDCCRHCHNLIFISAPIRIITSTPSFLISFREVQLHFAEKFFEIIKPPLV